MKAWLSDPMSVLNGSVFNANIFHPSAGTLTYSDHLLLQSLAMSPLYAVTGNLALCYNVLLIASLTLSGLAMHVLARSVTGSERAAVIAGLAWACWPYRTAHLAPSAIAVPVLPAAGAAGPAPGGRGAPLARCDVARRVGRTAGDLVGLLRRDVGDRDRGWRRFAGVDDGAVAQPPVLVAPRAGGGDRRRADRAGGVAVLGDAAARGVWAQPVRGGAELGDAAKLHAGPAREPAVRRERRDAAARARAGGPGSAEQRTPDVSGTGADRPGAVWRR